MNYAELLTGKHRRYHWIYSHRVWCADGIEIAEMISDAAWCWFRRFGDPRNNPWR